MDATASRATSAAPFVFHRYGPVVLVTGKSSGFSRLIVAMLNVGGLASYEADDGLQALNRLRTGGCAALLTTLDVPELSGVELIRYAKKHNPDMPVFVIREREPVGDEVEVLGCCDGVFGPPLKGSTVVTAIRAVLKVRT